MLVSPTGDIFAGNAFTVDCIVNLPPTVDIPVIVDVVWNEPPGTSLNFTSAVMMNNLNEYISIADVVSNIQSETINFQCMARVDSDSPYITASEIKDANVSVLVIGRPSRPNELTTSSDSTFINITWTNGANSVVHEYELHYSYHIRECQDNSVIMDSTRIDNSTKSYTLTNLEEDSKFNISLIASNPAGESEPATITATTSTAGTENLSFTMILLLLSLKFLAT